MDLTIGFLNGAGKLLVLGLVGGVLSTFAYVPYIRDTLKKNELSHNVRLG